MTTQTKTVNFFECLGEIWRDITAIEFLMRSAIARKDGEIEKFPKPPYTKGRIYTDYPKSFSISSFRKVADKFNTYFPKPVIPQKLVDLQELVDLRNGMAHGIIAKIDNSGVDQLIKFKELKNNRLKIEFSLTLQPAKLAQIRQSLKELRRYIMREADDKKYDHTN